MPPSSMHYCQASKHNPFHQAYHDYEYGFPCSKDQAFFELLCLEINQAGLSWLTVLKKRQAFRQAFCEFDINRVAGFNDTDQQRLLNNAEIIRNRLKIQAVIHNARVLQTMLDTHGSFKQILDWQQQHHQLDLQAWLKWFRQEFKFVGGEIVNEFLMSSGYLPGAHLESCPVYQQIIRLQPAWLKYSQPE